MVDSAEVFSAREDSRTLSCQTTGIKDAIGTDGGCRTKSKCYSHFMSGMCDSPKEIVWAHQ